MSDPRAERTRHRLRSALVEACVERPLGQVSVSEIVRLARVGRATFYLHYDDLHGLALDACAEIVREAVDALHAWDGPPDPARPPAALDALFVSVRERESLYRGLLRPGGGGPLGELLHEELRARSLAERTRRRPGGSAGERAGHELAACAVASAFSGLLADWAHGQVAAGPAELSAHVWRLLFAIHAAFGP